MKVAIVKYNAGNVRSVIFALHRLGVEPVWTDDADELRSADKVIFPGVGEASSAMEYLRVRRLDRLITELRQPVLGICMGLQLMCAHSEEHDTECLGIVPYHVRRFETDLKVPHVGWNAIGDLRGPLFEGISDGAYAYFVHSYFAPTGKKDCARTEYSLRFASAFQDRNYYAVQFHPEKSGDVGQQILANFLRLQTI